MLQDTKQGEPESFVGESKPEIKKEEKKVQPDLTPPEEFIYEQVPQEEKKT